MMVTFLVALALTAGQASAPQPPAKTAPNTTVTQKTAKATAAGTETLQLQVMLDRAGFSPGVIDGRNGPSTRKALEAYRKQVVGTSGDPAIEPLARYQITAEDTAGPFAESIPRNLVDQAKLPHLSYRSPVEALAERFHTTPEFLRKLNPAARFTAGEEIQVPNVVPMLSPKQTTRIAAAAGGRGRDSRGNQPAAAPAVQDVIVTVSKAASALTVTDAASGRVLLYAPVTTGSERDALPIGEWKVTGVSLNPPFNYNPDLFWDANPKDVKAKLPPGPNNPVGLVWIDISKEHYGLHGTPEPSTIGRTESHGCVRMTNWDALNVATLVRPGTKVVFTE